MSAPTRDEFVTRRRSGIGGSDIAAILGLSPWTTQVMLKREKKGELQIDETPAMRRGNVLEPVVAAEYSEHFGVKVVRHNAMLQDGIFIGNIDRLVVPASAKVAAVKGDIRTDKGLEIKTARDSRHWMDGVPDYYQTQVLWYMGLAPTIQSMDVAVKFCDSWENAYFTVNRDDELIAFMREQATEWWQKYIIEDKEPTPQNEADCRILWKKSNPGKVISANAEDMILINAYVEANMEAKAAKEKAEAIKTALVCRFADAEDIVTTDGKTLATYRSTSDSMKTDWEAVAKTIAPNGVVPEEVIAANTINRPGFRRLVIKKQK